jgi:hypothetical protein
MRLRISPSGAAFFSHPDLLPGVTPTFSPVMAQKLLPDLEMGGWFDVNMTEYKTEQHALAFRSGSD